VNTIEGADQYLPYIKAGMKGVVDDGGTASKYFKDFGLYRPDVRKRETAENSKIGLENHSWFVSFVLTRIRKSPIVSFIPNGYSGAEASPAARAFIEWYMDQKTLRTEVIGSARRQPALPVNRERMCNMSQAWMIASGKGGVGKSTLAAALAVGLATRGAQGGGWTPTSGFGAWM
jgi:hypothetical protein